MSNLFDGNYDARATSADLGKNPKSGKVVVRVEMEIMTEGPHRGRRLKYEGRLDPDNIKYTKSHMVALGWQGKKSTTFVDDVMKAPRVVPVEVRIAEYNGRQWSSIDRIGVFTPPLAALEPDKARDVDEWFAAAGDVGQASSGGDDLPF